MTEHSPTALQVFEDLAAEHLTQPQAARRTVFGRDCLTTGRRMVAFLHDDRLALKLPPATATALLASGKGVRPHMGERPMRHWVCVPLPRTRPSTITGISSSPMPAPMSGTHVPTRDPPNPARSSGGGRQGRPRAFRAPPSDSHAWSSTSPTIQA